MVGDGFARYIVHYSEKYMHKTHEVSTYADAVECCRQLRHCLCVEVLKIEVRN